MPVESSELKHETVTDLFTDIADAIRSKTGGNTPIVADTFPDAISSIPSTGITVDSLSVTQNGTYTATTGHAYSPVTVNVANSYSAGDEGKVVSNGALVSQTSATYTSNNTYDTTLINSVTVNVSSSGGSVTSGVKFIDYDGTVLNTYTRTEAMALTALPSNPSHTGLTAQGWNWTLAEIQDQLTYAPDQIIHVGQMYTTTSGKTEIDIVLKAPYLSPWLELQIRSPDQNDTIYVDWGDGSSLKSLTGASSWTKAYVNHEYSLGGSYTITLSAVNNATYRFYNDSNTGSGVLSDKNGSTSSQLYSDCVEAVRIGAGHATTFGNYAFRSCSNLQYITIPSTLTGTYSNQTFSGNTSLKSVTLPSGLASLPAEAFCNCYSLESVCIPKSVVTYDSSVFRYCYSLPYITISRSATYFDGYVFDCCYSLKYLYIPSGATSIGGYFAEYCFPLTEITISEGVRNISDHAFSYDYNLKSISLPSTLTSITGQFFYNCYTLTTVSIPTTNSITSIGDSAFRYCKSLRTFKIPSGVTSMGTYTFAYCETLESLTVPTGITSIPSYFCAYCTSLIDVNIPEGVTSIGTYAFRENLSLRNITIPSTVTSIGAYSFYGCTGVREMHLLPTSPPTLSNVNALTNTITSSSVIYVPRSDNQTVLTAYQTASNWVTYASYMQEEPQS